MGDRVYISYRRGDAAGYPLLIAERLRREFGEDDVFLDVASLQAGADWAAALSASVVSSCRAVVVVIGPGWLEATDSSGVRRRVDHPDDFGRREIQAALNGGLAIIPVLVDGAIMPRAASLPPSLASLADHQAVVLRADQFQAGLDSLTSALRRVIPVRERETEISGHLHPRLHSAAKSGAAGGAAKKGAARKGAAQKRSVLIPRRTRKPPAHTLPRLRVGAAPLESPAPQPHGPHFYVSYAWADSGDPDRDKNVDRLCDEAQKRGVVIRRDKDDLKIGDLISTFMEEIGRGDLVFVFLSDKYLRSPFCMSELSSLWRNNKQSTTEFLSHVRMFNVDGVKIRDSTDRLVYTQHWISQRDGLRKTINAIGWEEVGESPIAEFFRMKAIAGEVADIVAIFADAVQAQTFDDLVRESFPAAP